MDNKEKIVVIAGGSGLIGKRLTKMLIDKGYTVRTLTRKKKNNAANVFEWNPAEGTIQKEAMLNGQYIINLAGAGIADHRWTTSYKQEILQSRLDATHTLLEAIKNTSGIKAYIGASATGYYGNRGDTVLDESSNPGQGFLSSTVIEWEKASEDCKVRRVLIRTGIVLTPNGGALPPLARPVRAFIAPVIGGEQYMSWIHINDVCNMYLHAIEDEKWEGCYNAVAPDPIRLKDMMQVLKKVINPLAITIKVPNSIIRLMLGEQEAIITDSTNVKPTRALQQGFKFEFTDITDTIKNLYDR